MQVDRSNEKRGIQREMAGFASRYIARADPGVHSLLLTVTSGFGMIYGLGTIEAVLFVRLRE